MIYATDIPSSSVEASEMLITLIVQEFAGTSYGLIYLGDINHFF